MNVLALNCGSSSVKFQIVAAGTPKGGQRSVARGQVDRLGAEAVFRVEADGRPPFRESRALTDHAAAVKRIVDWAVASGVALDTVGHRVVHGGARFTQPCLVDGAVAAEIDRLEELAPLHNAPSLAGIRAARAALGARVPMVAVFDTAFHSTIPERAAAYAIPQALAEKHGIRRFGFHGTSYRWVLERYCALRSTTPERATIVAFHLGNGASAAAIEGGRSVDTSMGFTPLEGLVMGTRSGDVDPALVAFIAEREKLSPRKVEDLLNSKSGLLGLSGRSKDMRDLLEHERDDPRARLAVDVFCYRARKYLGAYLAVLRGADAVVFTGGIGEHAATVRARICDGMEWCGIRLDAERNDRVVGVEGEIGATSSKVRVFVIPTDEEWLIARDAADCLRRHMDV